MVFGLKTLYFCVINLICILKIALSTVEIIRYALIVVHNTTCHIVMIGSAMDLANETDCSTFKTPKIDQICEAGVLLRDFQVALTSNILEKRSETCFSSVKPIHYAALFLIEGDYDETEVARLKISDVRTWRRAFRPLKTKTVVGKNVTKENMEFYEWAKMNFARKGFDSMSLVGHMKWTANSLKLFHMKENDNARTAFGCRGYDFNYVEDESAGLLNFDTTILGYLAEKAQNSDFDNPCEDRGTSTEWEGKRVVGTGKYEECYELIKEIYSSNSLWKISDDVYKGTSLLGLEALNTLFRSILIGNITSKQFFRDESLSVCAGVKGGANSWANCGKLAFVDYLVHEKFCCRDGESHFIIRESAEEGQSLKRFSWLIGFVVVDHSFRYQTQCCKHRISTGSSVRTNPFYNLLFSFAFLLPLVNHYVVSIVVDCL